MIGWSFSSTVSDTAIPHRFLRRHLEDSPENSEATTSRRRYYSSPIRNPCLIARSVITSSTPTIRLARDRGQRVEGTQLYYIPAVLFGLLVGALLMLLVRDPQRLASGVAPSLVTAITTIVVGWWIHSAVRRRGELDRVPIAHISNLSQRIGELISDCLQATEANERLRLFRQLGIEIGFLCNLIKSTAALESIHLETLNLCYVSFKRCLTDSDSPDIALASQASNELRMAVLRIQWRFCQRIVDGTTDTGFFEPD